MLASSATTHVFNAHFDTQDSTVDQLRTEMASEFPCSSILTAAPQVNPQIVPSLGKTTKLYALLLFLFCFTDVTFASEHRIEQGKEFADTFFGHRKNLHGANTTFEEPVKEANSTAKDTKLDNRCTTLRPAYLEAGDPDPNYVVDYTSAYGTHDIMRYACNNPSLHSPHFSASSSLTWF
jgi:hypothetical protein